jgi:hypothetical protein
MTFITHTPGELRQFRVLAENAVMAGLVPAIHALSVAPKTWMRGSSPRMTVIVVFSAFLLMTLR